MGKRLFLTYCMQCHGSDAGGSRGFPNLTDGDWLWGGTPEQIQVSIANGRNGMMPNLGLSEEQDRQSDCLRHESVGPRCGCRQGRGR